MTLGGFHLGSWVESRQEPPPIPADVGASRTPASPLSPLHGDASTHTVDIPVAIESAPVAAGAAALDTPSSPVAHANPANAADNPSDSDSDSEYYRLALEEDEARREAEEAAAAAEEEAVEAAAAAAKEEDEAQREAPSLLEEPSLDATAPVAGTSAASAAAPAPAAGAASAAAPAPADDTVIEISSDDDTVIEISSDDDTVIEISSDDDSDDNNGTVKKQKREMSKSGIAALRRYEEGKNGGGA